MAFTPFFQRPKGVLLRISILRMLIDESMHGYQLMKQIEEDTNGTWVPSHSLLYNTLSTLEEQGFITSEKDFKGEVERTIYSITEEGKTHLDEQLSQLAHVFSRMMQAASEHPFPRMPRIFLEHLKPEERRQFLVQIKNRLEAALKEVKKDLAVLDSN
ncbi:MAG: PadR family transcriptional regulator [Promethearchaeota archaeon]